jgi:hypothetical protein
MEQIEMTKKQPEIPYVNISIEDKVFINQPKLYEMRKPVTK